MSSPIGTKSLEGSPHTSTVRVDSKRKRLNYKWWRKRWWKNALSQIIKNCAHDDTIQMNTASALVHTNTDSFLVCCELSCDWHCCCCCCCSALLLSLHYYYCHFYFFFFPLSSNVDVARTVIAQFSLLYSHHITEMLSTHLLLLFALYVRNSNNFNFRKFAGPVCEKNKWI